MQDRLSVLPRAFAASDGADCVGFFRKRRMREKRDPALQRSEKTPRRISEVNPKVWTKI